MPQATEPSDVDVRADGKILCITMSLPPNVSVKMEV